MRLVQDGPLGCRGALPRIGSTINKTGAKPRLALRPTANAAPGNKASKLGTTPTATSAMPKRNAADRMSGSTTNKKGTTPATETSSMAPKRNAADQMSCELINKKDPPPTPSPAVPISFWEEEARAVET